ncbi:D-hexose-6-phosphate mutarotase [candidate division KSB1 bacterium]|nr:D-hexose-6-phosphate mutarotase [candidate division KSB1 bacterium]
MGATNFAELNQQFGIFGQLNVKSGSVALPLIEVENANARARISAYGSHILSFKPHGHEDVLWISQKSDYESGKPIRGGIPICWPWFGSHPTDPQIPIHGFVRRVPWRILSTEKIDEGTTRIEIGLTHAEAMHETWRHRYELKSVITVSEQLDLELITRNIGDEAIVFSEALHTYFNVSEISEIEIEGLAGCAYIEEIDARKTHAIEPGKIRFNSEVDRVYQDTTAECIIIDPGFQRKIRIGKSGSLTTVVWNPWIAKSKRMPDFDDEEYHTMVCVETANAMKNTITLKPGETHSIRTQLSVESIL